MTEPLTMVRTDAVIDLTHYALAQNGDLDDLKRRIVAAVHSGGEFVDFVVVGNRTVSALITPRTSVVFTVETVDFDPRDTGDMNDPYGGEFDLLGPFDGHLAL